MPDDIRDRLAKFRDFRDRTAPADVRGGLVRVGRELARGPLSGRMVFAVTDEKRDYLLDLDESPGDDLPGPALKSPPDFIVFTKRQTLLEILSGELSPLQALLEGRLRYGGKETLGVAVLRELAQTSDAVFEPCRRARHAS